MKEDKKSTSQNAHCQEAKIIMWWPKLDTETTEHTKYDNALELHSMKIFYKWCMDLD